MGGGRTQTWHLHGITFGKYLHDESKHILPRKILTYGRATVFGHFDYNDKDDNSNYDFVMCTLHMITCRQIMH